MNLVHIGLPKAASTTLQNAVFTAQDHFAYIGKANNLYVDDRLLELITRISFQDSLEYDAARAQSLVQSMRGIPSAQSRPALISDEIFSVEGRVDRRLVAERLHALFAPAKVLVVLRAQPTFLQSMYLNHLRGSGQRIVSFEAWLEETYGGIRFPGIIRVGMDYEPLIRAYEETFGADKVVVLPLELIKDDASVFFTSLADLLHMPVASVQAAFERSADNQRLSRRHLLALRIQNLLPAGTNLAQLGRRLMPGGAYQRTRDFVSTGRRVASPDLPESWRGRIASLCARGNALLERRKNIPLRALGYPVES